MNIVLDPGHGGTDPGAVGNGLLEKDLNLFVAQLVKNNLLKYDVNVLLTRIGDQSLTLSGRADFANRNMADYFLSIHTNSGGGTGFESFVYTNASARTNSFRDALHNNIAPYFTSNGFRDRGKKQANFAVIRETKMPAVLIENLFIDSVTDAQRLKEVSFLEGLASVITNGIVEALKLQEIQPGTRKTPVMGSPKVKLEQAKAFISARNPEYVGIVDAYYDIATIYKIRPEVAISQAAKETGFFHFGNDVKPEQNNFAGIGATGGGVPGASFPSKEMGVEAHLQHLYAYASEGPLPEGRQQLDPRFNLVERGSSIYVEDLGGKWAPSPDYGISIVNDYLNKLMAISVPDIPTPTLPVTTDCTILEQRIKELEEENSAFRKVLVQIADLVKNY